MNNASRCILTVCQSYHKIDSLSIFPRDSLGKDEKEMFGPGGINLEPIRY